MAGTTEISGRVSARWEFGSVFCTLVLCALGFVVLYPLILLILNSFQISRPGEAARFSLDGWNAALSEPGMLTAIWNTVGLTVVRQLISLPIGILLAWILARTNIPGRNWLPLLFWISYFMPSLAVTQGMILLFDPKFGLANQALVGILPLESGPFNIYSWWGIVATHVIAHTLALKVILLTTAFANMNASLEEASKVCGVSSLGTLTRIVIPSMAPAITAVLLMSTIRGLEAFEIEMVLGSPPRIDVFSTKIFRLIHQEPPLFGPATALSVLILMIMFPFILAQRWITTHRRYTTVGSHYKNQLIDLGRWKWPVFITVLLSAFLVSVSPVVFLLMGTFMKLYGFFDLAQPWTLKHWQTVLQDPIFLQSLSNTFILAFGTSFLSVIVCSVVAYIVIRTKFWGRALLDIISWLPYTLPGIVLGLGLLWLFLGSFVFQPLYGTIFVLIIASALGTLTLGTQIIKSNFIQLGSELEEASWISGGSRLYTLKRVVIPIFSPVLISVAVLSFVSAARNISNVALLAVGTNRPLSLLQLDYMVEGQYEAASVLGTLVALISVGVLLLARVMGLRVGIRDS